jgi:hypothetical protein
VLLVAVAAVSAFDHHDFAVIALAAALLGRSLQQVRCCAVGA